MEQFMHIIGILIMIVGLVFFGVLVYAKYYPNKFKTNRDYDVKKTITLSAICLAISVIGFIITIETYLMINSLQILGKSRILAYFGYILMVASIMFYFSVMWLEHKKIILDEKKMGRLHALQLTSIFTTIIFLFFMLEGIVSLITFPLPTKIVGIGKIGITYYATFIFCGAGVAYFVAVKKFMKLGYKRNLLENLFYVAFPAGIVGSRLWYVIAEWNKKGFSENFMEVFNFLDGGLAIQGGVLLGAIVGIWFMLKYRKNVNIFMAADLIVPGILLAQGIGRWGNFFNFEVYGGEALRSSWNFLPDFILNQMMVPGNQAMIKIPLFLIEAMINIAGYFVIVYGVGRPLKKYLVYGDIGCCYFIWYGIVRAIMEPLRDGGFKMGQGIMASQVMAFVFIIGGILGIITLHILKKKKPKLFEANYPNKNTIEAGILSEQV